MDTLGFANPALVWGGLAVLLPVAIHLLSRRRARRLAFSAVEFILRSKKQKVRHIRLKQLLLLLLRTIAVAAVAFALARPLFQAPANAAQAAGPRSAVGLVLDGSLSMHYRLGSKTLFERAQEEALSLVDALPPESPVTLVACDGHTPEVEPPGFDRVAVKNRIRALTPSFRAAELNGCMAAAARALGESPLEGKKLLVVTDLTAPSLQLGAPPPRVPTPKGEVTPEIVFVDAAREKLPNVSVAEVTLQPSAALGPRGFEIVATLRNSADAPATNLAVALEVGGTVVTRGFTDVPAHGSSRKVLAHRFEPGTQLARVVLAGDALAEDDARAFVLRVPRDVRALVVDGDPSAVRYRDEAFFVEAALGSDRSGGRLGATFLDADAAQARNLSDFDVILLLNLPTPRTAFVESLRRFVEAGGGLFFSMGDQVSPDEYNAAFGSLLPRPLHLVRTAAEPDDTGGPPPARFARVDVTHPALAPFENTTEGFDTAKIYRYVQLQPETQKDERILASLDDGSPAFVEARRGLGRVVLFTSSVDRDWTDWPIRTSFLPTMQQISAYLAGGLDEAPPKPVRVGETRPLPVLAEGTTLVDVKGPDGKPVRLVDDGIPVEAPGHYLVQVRDANGVRPAPEHTFAGVLDPRESDTSRLSQEEVQAVLGGDAAATVAGGAAGAIPKTGTPIWTWLLLAAVLAFVAEGFVVRAG